MTAKGRNAKGNNLRWKEGRNEGRKEERKKGRQEERKEGRKEGKRKVVGKEGNGNEKGRK